MPIRQGLAEEDRQSTALPAEIGFLAHYGFAPEVLQQAAVLAGFSGVSVDTFLLRHGLIEEQTFYRALAAELGLPFKSSPRLSPDATYPGAILSGVAPLGESEGGLIMAPAGPFLAKLLQTRRLPSPSLSITTPSQLAKAVFQAQARAIAHHAANDLADRSPNMSSRDGATAAQVASVAAAALALSFSGTLAPVISFALSAAGMSPLFIGLILLRLAASCLPNPIEPKALPPRDEDAALPVYTIIVALYREKRIASRLIAALTRFDYPAAKLDIKLVLEADDRETLDALASLPLPPFIEVIIAPLGHPRTKPRALNVALPLARGVFTVIYDAEDVPDPGQLRLAASLFTQRPDIACLQARLTIDNTDDSWITRLFTIEYAALFDVFNPGLAEIGSPIPLGGTSNHFRTSVLKDLHGWDAWNVTEDADLGIRLARRGYRVADLPSSTLEEAPSTLSAWMRQRTRWMKGFMQTCISHSRTPLTALVELGFWRFYCAVVLTLGTVLSALGYPLFAAFYLIPRLLGKTWVLEAEWEALWFAWSLTLFVMGLAAMIIPACVALKRRRLWHLLPWVPLLPLYYGLVSLAAWRGLWELATAPFRWNKTSHGLARTSRSGLFQKHQARAATTRSLKTTPP